MSCHLIFLQRGFQQEIVHVSCFDKFHAHRFKNRYVIISQQARLPLDSKRLKCCQQLFNMLSKLVEPIAFLVGCVDPCTFEIS